MRRSSRKLRVIAGLSLSLVLLAVGLVGSAVGLPALRGASGTLWVTNRTGDPGSVTVFDAGTGDVIGTITVGSRPTAVLAPAGTGKVYVSNGVPGNHANTVSVISKETLSVIATIDTGPGSDPHHMAQSRDGRFVYVALFGTRTVAVIDTATDTVVDTLEASGHSAARTHAVWVSADGRTVYATNSLGSSSSSPPGTVSAIDVATGNRLWEVFVGQNPSEILVTNDGKTAYVTVRTEDVVRVLDLTANPPTISATVPIGDQPDTLLLTNDNRTLVVTLRGTAAVTLMDTRTLQTRTVPVAGTTTGHHWLSANGRYTFVAVVGQSGQSGVAVIDNVTAVVVRSYLLPGTADPHGVFFEPSRLFADRGTSIGRFTTLPAGQALGLAVSGSATLSRHQGGTTATVMVRGLTPGQTYAAHLHNAPCNNPGNPGGGHYQNVVGGAPTPPNELWLSSTGVPSAGITANRTGTARGFGSAEWVARPDARSIVIHQIPEGGSTAGGPKIACADLV